MGKQDPQTEPRVATADPAPASVPASIPGLRVRTLGAFVIWRDGIELPLKRAAAGMAGALFKWLLASPGNQMPREQAMDLLWPEADPASSMNNLRVLVHRLRRILDIPGCARSYLRYDGELLTLTPVLDGAPHAAWLDAAAFDRAARAALSRPETEACRDALALYTGEYLPEDTYREWAIRQREELSRLQLKLLVHLAMLATELGRLDESERCLEAVLRADSCHEVAACGLMRLQATSGRRTDAIRTYRRLVEALGRELSAAPESATQHLYQAVLAGSLTMRPAATECGDRTARPVQPALDLSATIVHRLAVTATTQSAVLIANVPLLGRERELTLLEGALDSALAGQGGFVLLHGAAGMGKTRLLAWVLQRAKEQGALVLLGRAYRQESRLPYGPIEEALQSYVAVQPRSVLAGQSASLAVLARIVPELARLLPDLPAPPALEPRAERNRVFAALAGLLQDLARSGPVVLALDDLHWADPTTLQALHYLQRNCRTLPVLIVGTYRDDEATMAPAVAALLADLTTAPTATAVGVAPLGLPETTALVGAVLAADTVDADLVARIQERAHGNPLFVIELIDALAAAGRLTCSDGCGRLSGSGPLPLPDSVRMLVMRQVRQVGAVPAQLVRQCAVLGDRLSYPVLTAASDLPEEALLDALDVLVAAGLLDETAHGYAFHHPLFPDAIYQTLSPRRRTLLHRRAADALLSHAVATGAETEHAGELARHFGQAACFEQAARYAELAGDRAAALYALFEAVPHYVQAREHLELVADSAGPAVRTAGARLGEKLGDLHMLDGSYVLAEACFAGARALAQDGEKVIELLRKQSDTWEKRGEYARALSVLDEAAALGEAGFSPGMRASLEVSRGQVYFRQGLFEEAESIAAGAVARLRDAAPSPLTAHAYQLLGDIVYERNDQDRADDYFQMSLAIRTELGDEQGIAVSWNGQGIVAYDRGDYERAEACLRRSLAIRERIGDQWGVGSCWNNLGNVEYDRGELRTAAESYERSRLIWQTLGEQRALAATWNNLGAVAQARGDLVQAEQGYQRSLEIRERIGEQPALGGVWTNLGSVATARGNLKEAGECFRRALFILERTGPQEYLAGTWSAMGDLACEEGDCATALVRYRETCRLSRQVGMPDMEGLTLLHRARAHLRHEHQERRRLGTAAALLARAEQLTSKHDLGGIRIEAMLIRAEIELRRGSIEGASATAQEALRLAVIGQQRLGEAQAHRLIGQCAQAHGQVTDARAALQAAHTIFVELGAALEATRTERILLLCAPN